MIVRRLPSGDLDGMRRGMEQLLDSLATSTGWPTAGVYPAVNVSEDSESVLVRADQIIETVARLEEMPNITSLTDLLKP